MTFCQVAEKQSLHCPYWDSNIKKIFQLCNKKHLSILSFLYTNIITTLQILNLNKDESCCRLAWLHQTSYFR